jgi:hypothetical protein
MILLATVSIGCEDVKLLPRIVLDEGSQILYALPDFVLSCSLLSKGARNIQRFSLTVLSEEAA